jgi:hypothetical protein
VVGIEKAKARLVVQPGDGPLDLGNDLSAFTHESFMSHL